MDNLKNYIEIFVLLFLYFLVWQAATETYALFRNVLTTSVAFASVLILIRFMHLFLTNTLKDSAGVFRRNVLMFLFSLFGLAVVGINFVPEFNQFREQYYYVLSVMVATLMMKLLIEYKIIGKFDVYKSKSKSVVQNELYN